jgi:ankyrin repeat protein
MHKYAKYPLLTAIERCHPEVVSLLISHGAEIDIVKISNNGTALHVACSEGTLDMVKTLVNNGSCINAETYSGQTPLFYCLRSVPHHAVSRVYPIYMDGIGCGCCYISHSLASYEDNIQEGNDIMEYLIQQGATLSCKDDSGRTPLEHAVMTNRTSSTFIFLKYGARISGEHLDKFPWNLHSWYGSIQDQIPNVHLFRLLLKSNFEFSTFVPVYLEKLRDLTSTESFLSFLKEFEQPLSLKNQCRIAIRNMIFTDTGVQFIRSLNILGLPKLLQGFLMFDDFDQSIGLPAEFRLQQ